MPDALRDAVEKLLSDAMPTHDEHGTSTGFHEVESDDIDALRAAIAAPTEPDAGRPTATCEWVWNTDTLSWDMCDGDGFYSLDDEPRTPGEFCPCCGKRIEVKDADLQT